MTQAELDALPECGGFDAVERDGKIIPVPRPNFAFWVGDDETFSVIDNQGRNWMIGWANGKRWKRRAGFI